MSILTNIVKGRVIGNGLKKATAPIAADDVVNKDYVDNQIADKKSSYAIKFGVYDQGGTATATGGNAVSVGDNVIAFDTVGGFVINTVYRCTIAGSASTATFTAVPLTENLQIIPTEFITDPNDNTKYFEADIIYLYDGATQAWVENGQRESVGDVHGLHTKVSFNSTISGFSLPMPRNGTILSLDIICETAFDGTGALLTIGEASDQDKILQSADINLHDYFAGETDEFKPRDQVSGGLITFTNRTPINAYFTPALGGTAGSIELIIKYLGK